MSDSGLILPPHMEKEKATIPMEFVNRVPDIILRQISWGFVNAISRKDGKAADHFLIQLMMEVDLAGKSLNEELDKKAAKKKVRRKAAKK